MNVVAKLSHSSLRVNDFVIDKWMDHRGEFFRLYNVVFQRKVFCKFRSMHLVQDYIDNYQKSLQANCVNWFKQD